MSTLKLAAKPASSFDPDTKGKIGFVGASFRWNSGKSGAHDKAKDPDPKMKKPDVKKVTNGHHASESTPAATEEGAVAVVEEEEEPRVFELTDSELIRDTRSKEKMEENENENEKLTSSFRRSVSFVFPSGKLNIVTGATGAGKSALLSALLGELDIIQGHILLPKDVSSFDASGLTNSISFAGQTAWLQNLSIKDNMYVFLRIIFDGASPQRGIGDRSSN